MRFHRPPRAEPGIDMASFADIAFLLIIFFILTTTFVQTRGREIEIPSGTPDPANKQDEMASVQISNEAIFYRGETDPLTMEQLRDKLLAEDFPARPEGRRLVILESADEVRCDRYYPVVMAIVDAGGVLAMLEEKRVD